MADPESRKTSKTWREFYEEPLEFQRMLAWATTHAPLLEALEGTQSVLEIGTGTAVLAAFNSLLHRHTVSVDLDANIQVVARHNVDRLHGKVNFVTGDAFSLPFPDHAFDASFSQGFFEHFSDHDIRQLIDEQLRVASRVILSVPNRWYPHLGRRGPGLIGNERLLPAGRWRAILEAYDPRVSDYPDPKALSIAGVALGPRMHTLVVIGT